MSIAKNTPALVADTVFSWVVVLALITATATSALIALAAVGGWSRNMTDSLPGLVYRPIPGVNIARGDLVQFCLEATLPIVSQLKDRGYIPPGRCAGELAPVIKPVAAIAGDIVELSAAGVRVNGHPIPNSKSQTTDSKGRSITAYPEGRYQVAAGELWIIATYNPRSFDSRYMGPIQLGQVAHLVKEVF